MPGKFSSFRKETVRGASSAASLLLWLVVVEVCGVNCVAGGFCTMVISTWSGHYLLAQNLPLLFRTQLIFNYSQHLLSRPYLKISKIKRNSITFTSLYTITYI